MGLRLIRRPPRKVRSLRTLVVVELAGIQAAAKGATTGPFPSYLLGRQKAYQFVLDAIDGRWPPERRPT